MASDRYFGFCGRRNRMQPGGARRVEPEDGALHLRRLVLCRFCGCDFVAVLDAMESDDGERWAVILRCGACEERRSVLASSGEVDQLLNLLEWDAIQLKAEAEHLWRERTADEIEIFVAALEGDLIGTDDFER